MTDERLQILKMVQEGRVSAEEAAKLLEALNPPAAKPVGPKPAHVRIRLVDGRKRQDFSIGVGFVTWVFNLLPGTISFDDGSRFDRAVLQEAIANGVAGKVFEGEEDGRRVEIWLDA